MFARRSVAAGGVPRKRTGNNYAESAARSSVMSKTKRGAASVVESSAWGGSDDTGIESVKGDIQNQYIEMLRKTKKRNKGPAALTPEWLPEAKWESVKSVHEAAGPVARAAHSIISVPSSGPQAVESLCIIGGSASSVYAPKRQPREPKGVSRGEPKEKEKDKDKEKEKQQEVTVKEPPVVLPRLDQGMSSFKLVPKVSNGGGDPSASDLQAEWQHSRLPPPPKRLLNSSVCVMPSVDRVAVFGGLDAETKQISGGLFVLELSTNKWVDLSNLEDGPNPCIEHAVTEVDAGRSMLLHGGRFSLDHDTLPTSQVRKLECINGKMRWSQVKPQPGTALEYICDSQLARPPVRRNHTLCSRGASDGAACVYIFGGHNDRNEICADLTVFDIERCVFLAVDAAGAQPIPRAYHTAVKLGPYMAVYGGINATGIPIGELRLLHLPTLLWSNPSSQGIPPQLPSGDERSGNEENVSPTNARTSRKLKSLLSAKFADEGPFEPPPRYRHAAVALSSGHKPGQRAMLVFGGYVGDHSSGDILRLVLQLPRERPPGCAERAHPDKIYEFVMGNLENAMKDAKTNHQEQVEEMAVRKKSMLEEARNMETRLMSLEAEVEKHDSALMARNAEKDQLEAEIALQEEQLETLQKETKRRLRDLEVEAESLGAKAHRLEKEATTASDGTIPERDVDFNTGNPVAVVTNVLAPGGFVDRRDVRWKSARVTAEGIMLGPKSTDSRPVSPIRESSPTSPVSTEGRRSSSPSLALRPRSRTGVPDPKGAELLRWQTAARSELRVVAMLRHPSLQELYGICLDRSCLYALSEPLMESLATRLGLSRHPASPPAGRPAQPVAPRRSSNLRGSIIRNQRRVSIEGMTPLNTWFLGEAQKLHISRDLAAVVEYMHTKGVTHRHICLENIYIRDQGPDVNPIVKLGGHFMARVTCRVRGEPAVPQPALQPDMAELAQELASLGLSGIAGSKLHVARIPTRSASPEGSLTPGARPPGRTSPAESLTPPSSEVQGPPGASMAGPFDPDPPRYGYKMGAFDARDLDVRALGNVLLHLWLFQDAKKRKVNTQASMHQQQLTPGLQDGFTAQGRPLKVSGIRDPSMRFIVTSCLRPGTAGAPGSCTGSRPATPLEGVSYWHSVGSLEGLCKDGRPPSASSLRAALAELQVKDVDTMPELEEDLSRSAVLADHAVDPQADERKTGSKASSQSSQLRLTASPL